MMPSCDKFSLSLTLLKLHLVIIIIIIIIIQTPIWGIFVNMDSYPELYQVTEDNFVQFSTYIKRIISDNSDRMVIRRLQYINLGGVAEYKDTKTKFDLMLMDTLKNKGAYETLRGLVISIHVKDLVGGCLCVCVCG